MRLMGFEGFKGCGFDWDALLMKGAMAVYKQHD